MQLYIDTASESDAREFARYGFIDGVTTNPSLVASTDSSYRTVVETLADAVDGPVFAQVLAEDADGMVEQARTYDAWADDVVVKLPATRAGYEALGRIRADGIEAGITVLFSVTQAILAAKNDATFVAPYVGRLDDAGEDGLEVVAGIQTAFDEYGFETEVLAASVRNRRQATALYRAGVDAVTLPPTVLEAHFDHHKTAEGVAGFLSDWGTRGNPIESDD
ncbi:transaldolase family protein [Halosolutus halophilus]|uniref:transaldolase family protein n=1 Tax=Halosolutus halophilus TaxID=1552990 RepID=UPI002235240A|nr:transaldolase family protein [Halosolutus halophilus]